MGYGHQQAVATQNAAPKGLPFCVGASAPLRGAGITPALGRPG